jgi:hypothetical protein
MLSHPDFPTALRRFLGGFLRLQDGWLINKLNADEGRHLLSILAMALHAERELDPEHPGLTLARLNQLCVPLGLMSHGRTEATLGLLRRSGLLLDAPPGPDRRRRRLEPAPELVTQFRTRIGFHLEALELLSPGHGLSGHLARDPRFFWRLAVLRARAIIEEPSLVSRFPPLAAVANTEGGYVVLCALLHALAQPPHGLEPGPVALPYSEHAKRFGLSRTQMRRVVQRLAEYGMVRPAAPGGQAIEVLPLAVETMSGLTATRVLRMERLGREALRTHALPVLAVTGRD